MKAVKIRKDIESYKFVFNGQQIKTTMSMGVAGFPGDAATRRALIEKADKALYKAKDEGRNRVIKAS
jgi:diguanylate cyclase (GGDEF)-like protein